MLFARPWKTLPDAHEPHLRESIKPFFSIGRIDQRTYEQQRDRLRQEITLIEVQLADVVTDHLDVEGVLAFAEHLLTNAARLRLGLKSDQKRQLQQTLFPEGLRSDGDFNVLGFQ